MCDVSYLARYTQQTDVRETSDAHHRLMPPLWDRGHNNIYFYNITADIVLIKYTPENCFFKHKYK